jgi:hypothetical protein
MSDERTLGEKLISPHNLTNAEKDEDGVPVVVKVAARAIAQLRVTFILRGSLDETQLNELFDASALFAEWTREQHAELATLRDSKEVKVPSVFDEIEAELLRAEAKFPDQHLPNFPERMDWDHATAERDQAQELTDRCHAKGVVTWWHVLREEVYEAFAESDPAKLRAELIQVGAMAVRWIEDLDRAIAVVVSEYDKP